MKRFIFLSIFAVFFSFGIANADLVAYYPFDGNANDQSGNGNDGIVNGAILSTDRYGNNNNAYSFDGIDDYIYISTGEQWFSNDYTITMWVNFFNFSNNYPILLIGENHNIELHGLGPIYEQYGNSHQIVFYRHDETSKSRSELLYSGTELSVNKWHMISVLKEGMTFKMFINDSLVAEIESELNEIAPYGSFVTLGGVPSSPSNAFEGQLDEILIYNRALSGASIQVLYNDSNPVPEPATMLLLGSGLIGLAGVRRKNRT